MLTPPVSLLPYGVWCLPQSGVNHCEDFIGATRVLLGRMPFLTPTCLIAYMRQAPTLPQPFIAGTHFTDPGGMDGWVDRWQRLSPRWEPYLRWCAPQAHAQPFAPRCHLPKTLQVNNFAQSCYGIVSASLRDELLAYIVFWLSSQVTLPLSYHALLLFK